MSESNADEPHLTAADDEDGLVLDLPCDHERAVWLHLGEFLGHIELID